MLSIKSYIQKPSLLGIALLRDYGGYLPDKLYLRLLFRLKMGKWPNLSHPKTFNEKLQWLKLYDRRPEYTQMVDKVAVKNYVANIIGREHIIPTLGVWERPEDIEWDTLPKQFVLKTTHGSGSSGVVICKDKDTFDKEAAIKKLDQSMKTDVYKRLREWPYKNIRKRILAEDFITAEGNKDLADYKVYCFSGEPQFIFVCDNRYSDTGMTVDCYSIEWKHMDVKVAGHENPGGHPKPVLLTKMLEMAQKLSNGIPHIRTDFYYTGTKIYFSELTFFSSSGHGKLEPDSYDSQWGKYLQLDTEL